MSEEKATSMKPFLKMLWKIVKTITAPIWIPLKKIFKHEEAWMLLFFPAMMFIAFSPTGMDFLIEEGNQTATCQERYGNASFKPDTECYNYTSLKLDTVEFMKNNGAATEDALQPYIGVEDSYDMPDFTQRMQEERVLVQIGETDSGDKVYYLNRARYDVSKPDATVTDMEVTTNGDR